MVQPDGGGIVIGGTVRTAIGRFQGGLSPFRAPDLGGKVIAESIRRAGVNPKDCLLYTSPSP
ncbi:MAG: hypothetical protein N2234_08530, partial [Planctomycetota bacterium]|nr:hypothetical protein [Planctomycetota bacterium]